MLAVWHTMREALYRARTGAGPTLIECKTYRWHGHSEHDKAMYRSEEEFIEWKSRDPLPRFEIYLKEKKILTDEVRESVAGQAGEVITDAVAFADNSPEPSAEEATTDVFTP